MTRLDSIRRSSAGTRWNGSVPSRDTCGCDDEDEDAGLEEDEEVELVGAPGALLVLLPPLAAVPVELAGGLVAAAEDISLLCKLDPVVCVANSSSRRSCEHARSKRLGWLKHDSSMLFHILHRYGNSMLPARHTFSG